MKKTLIALAIAGVSFNAAAVDLDNKLAPGIAAYAKEIKIPGVLTNNTPDEAIDNLSVVFKLGFSATAGVKRFVRLDLTNATFKTPVAPSDLVNETETPIELNTVVSAGGKTGDSFVILEITPSADVPKDEQLTFKLADINAQDRIASVQYRLFETGVAASTPGTANALADKSGTLFTVNTSALTVNAADQKAIIDVTKLSKSFVTSNNSAVLSKINIAANGDVKLATGIAADDATVAPLLEKAQLNITGNFAAGAKSGTVLDEGTAVLLDGASVVIDSLTPGKVSFTVDLETAPLTNSDLSYTVDESTQIEPGIYKATLVLEAADSDYAFSNVDLGTIATLAANGAFQDLDVIMKPAGAFKHFVRISNTSTQAGAFYITVTNDQGESEVVTLAEVTGQAKLAPQASTAQLTVESIYNAAVTKGLAPIEKGEKLRLKVAGDVPTLNAQSYVLSVDDSTLIQFD